MNAIRSTLGCLVSAAPASSPIPCTTLNAPSGKPASRVRSARIEALHRLVERADVLLTNMLPARLARLGLDPAALHAKRPELIVARLSGFGPSGDEADTPAFDYSSYWARTGFMDLLHEPGATPAFQRPGMGDHSASLALVVGLLSALRQRERGAPGQVIDVSLQHIGFYILGNDTAMTLVTGQTPRRHDRTSPPQPAVEPLPDARRPLARSW